MFTVEIGSLNIKSEKGQFWFWIKNSPVGDLNNTSRLSYAIKACKELLEIKDTLYNSDFDKMTKEEIFSYCMFLDKDIQKFSKDDHRLYFSLKKYSLFFGDQLDNMSQVMYYKNEVFHFLWSYNNDYSGKKIDYLKNFKYSQVPSVEVEKVVNAFLKAITILLQ